jgi:hypothetical protein
MNFKVGDRVRHHHDGKWYAGTVVYITENDVAVQFDDPQIGVGYTANGKCYHGWWLPENQWEAIKVDSKIVITRDGATTLARQYQDGKVIKSAEAKCSPSDTYDFSIGANLAYDRLMGRNVAVNPASSVPSAFDWDKFKRGEIGVRCDTAEKSRAFRNEVEKKYPDAHQVKRDPYDGEMFIYDNYTEPNGIWYAYTDHDYA